MAEVTYLDIIDGANATFTSIATRVERIAKVSGVTGDADAKLYNAVISPGMPTLGSSHPSIPGITLTQMIPKAESNDVVLVRLVYESIVISPNTITIAGTLTQTQTNFDVAGNAIVVSYIYPDPWYPNPEFAGQTIHKSQYVPFLKPSINLTVTRTMTSIPWSHINEYNGTINRQSFRVNNETIIGNQQWMCSVTASSRDGGSTYGVTYNFQHNPSTWNPEVVYTDPHFGGPPSDVDNPIAQPNAALTYQIYSVTEFNSLHLW